MDTAGDDKITDKLQLKKMPNGDVTEWTETEIAEKNAQCLIGNAGVYCTDYKQLTFKEF